MQGGLRLSKCGDQSDQDLKKDIRSYVENTRRLARSQIHKKEPAQMKRHEGNKSSATIFMHRITPVVPRITHWRKRIQHRR